MKKVNSFPMLLDGKTGDKQRHHKRCRVVNGKLVSVFAPGMGIQMKLQTRQCVESALATIEFCSWYRPRDFARLRLEVKNMETTMLRRRKAFSYTQERVQ